MSRFTTVADLGAEARIQKDLDRILREVITLAKGVDSLEAIYLLGGYARGDGTAVQTHPGKWLGFNDYDLLVVFRRLPENRGKYQQVAKSLALELEIDFVDLGIVDLQQLQTGEPTLFWHEFYRSHKVLWQRDDQVLSLPAVEVETLDPLEPTRLLHNRGMALLWAGIRLWPEGSPLESNLVQVPKDLQFSRIAAHKAILAAGEAHLLVAHTWSIYQGERAQLVRRTPPEWADEGFQSRYAAAVEFRRSPGERPGAEIAILWNSARIDLEQSMQWVHRQWLGVVFDSWKQQKRCVRKRICMARLTHPRLLKRWLVGRDKANLSEPGWFSELPQLLFPGPLGEPWAESQTRWRESAQQLVQAWHP